MQGITLGSTILTSLLDPSLEGYSGSIILLAALNCEFRPITRHDRFVVPSHLVFI